MKNLNEFDQAKEFYILGFQNIHLVDLDGALKGDLINKLFSFL